MGYESRISTKGQVVVPKALRERQDWKPGDRVEFVERNGAVELRAMPIERETKATAEEILARLKARNLYKGPTVSIEEMDRGVREAVREKWLKRFG